MRAAAPLLQEGRHGGNVLGERPPRRNDIDWLRIAAVLLLIPYHTARCFNWEEDFYVKNDPPWQPAQRFVDFVGPWHMSFVGLLGLGHGFLMGGGRVLKYETEPPTPATSCTRR